MFKKKNLLDVCVISKNIKTIVILYKAQAPLTLELIPKVTMF